MGNFKKNLLTYLRAQQVIFHFITPPNMLQGWLG